MIDYVTHTRIGHCENYKPMTETGSHVTLRIHLMHSMPTFDTQFSFITQYHYSCSVAVQSTLSIKGIKTAGVTINSNHVKIDQQVCTHVLAD